MVDPLIQNSYVIFELKLPLYRPFILSEIESRTVFCWLDNILRLVCRVSLLSVGAHVDGECNVCEVFRRNNFCYCNYSLLITTPRLNMVAATAYLLLAG